MGFSESARIIGVDLGLKRVGVAISDEMRLMAHPLCVLPYEGMDKLARALSDLADVHGATSFVVGLPKNMDGSVGESGRRSQKFAKRLERASSRPVFLSDERLTTSQAEKEMIALGRSRRQRKSAIDEAAAVLILENYLRSPAATFNSEGQ